MLMFLIFISSLLTETYILFSFLGEPPNLLPLLALLLLLLIPLCVYVWKKKKTSGFYVVQSGKEHEMRPLSNGETS